MTPPFWSAACLIRPPGLATSTEYVWSSSAHFTSPGGP